MKRLFVFFLLVLFFAGAALGAAVPSIVKSIAIEGNQTISEKDISSVIFTRAGASLSQEKVSDDLKAIYGMGYFSDVASSFEAVAGGTRVVFRVKENPAVKSIRLDGNTVYSTAELISMLDTKPGAILNFKKLQGDIDKINSRYKKDGYVLARVANVDTSNNILDFFLVEGMLESISLSGNENTKDYVILREMKTRSGSVLNEETLKKDLRRIFNLGFFSEVTPNFMPGTTKDRVILQLNIKETRSSTINFGGGYGEREGWFGFVDLSINNLMGTAQGLMLRAQSGQQLSTYQFKYNNPWFWPEKTGDHTSFAFRRWLTVGRDMFIAAQDGIYNGFDISFGKPLRDNYNATLTLGSENVSPTSTATFDAYRSDTIAVNLTYDTRDFWLNPKEGRYYSLDLKEGWKSTSINTTFSKIGLDLNHYYPVFNGQVLALHGGIGMGMGDVPIGEIYWAGGANSVRGYYPSEAHTGNYKIIANAEYRMNFSDAFQGVFFYDWGNAWTHGGINYANFISGWGPGVRVNTPLGPIRLDYGVAGARSFSEGVMHFSIGQAF